MVPVASRQTVHGSPRGRAEGLEVPQPPPSPPVERRAHDRRHEIPAIRGTVAADHTPAPEWMRSAFRWAERTVFFIIGMLLFVSALALARQGVTVLIGLIEGDPGSSIALTASFLDIVLLILMIGEIAYTVGLSLRGSVLRAQPFLIVGLIAVIRRILVLTVHEVQNKPSPASVLTPGTPDLGVLALVVMVFVLALYLLRERTAA